MGLRSPIFPVSLDQLKCLSRYLRVLKESEKYLTSSAFEKIQLVGLKVLTLSKMFKARDWESLTEILSVGMDKTKKEGLEIMTKGLKKKRRRKSKTKLPLNGFSL